jgi:uncharacterized protein YyaL (SSP411 family)
MEVARVFMTYGQYVDNQEYMAIAKRMARYVLSLQRPEGWFEGSFPFYRFIPRSADEVDIGSPEEQEVTFPNDNGKISERLLWFYKQTNDDSFGQAARRSVDYLRRVQAEDGSFSCNDAGEQPALKGVEFVAWPTIALMQAGTAFNDLAYRDAAMKGLGWISKQLTPSGRVRTSYETAQTEAWRPPSSETAVALKAYAIVARYMQDHAIWNGMFKISNAVLALQDKSGAIRNCDVESASASKQNDPDLADMVYTNGYALLALQEAYRANADGRYREAAIKLADFLVSVQCWGESGQWDGSWRGSYSLKRKRWAGRANQENELDEGGMYSAYTGWSTAPITYGLLRMLKK